MKNKIEELEDKIKLLEIEVEALKTRPLIKEKVIHRHHYPESYYTSGTCIGGF